MRDAQARTIHRKDYQSPAYLIDQTQLSFDLQEGYTDVHSQLSMRRNPDNDADTAPLVLDGVALQTLRIAIDGRELNETEYRIADEQLFIPSVPEAFTFECVTRIDPDSNDALEGLYRSSGMYCTQCEAEGFRRITWYLDRPDVLSVFTVTIRADATRYPVLLSNGNRVSEQKEAGNRLCSVWHDPWPKPSYLFALVAGDLQSLDDRFVTASGKTVDLHIFVEPKDLDKCEHAMESLKASMAWDEEVYGREYDLDVFNIVAVDDFNMGAMENKSLNIFNTSCVLAKPETTSDVGFQRVEAVVAHEYFHNWSGNRVTCRDWFQLSLKEGFTVFRDSQFSADRGSSVVKRVEDVSLLRTVQFAEDAGPMAHPIRPDSYMEISNFYTVTIYEKGAEVLRMLHTLLGPEQFRRGSDLYFERHDGQAATCEDFVKAMEDASGIDLQQFRHWYSQAGTPELHVTGRYDEEQSEYHLTVEQSCPATPGQSDKLPFHIPLSLALLGDAGQIALKLKDEALDTEQADNTERVLNIQQRRETFVFTEVPEEPVPSLLRGFSAPVKLNFDYSRDQLALLMRLDSDGFVRWDAAQQLARQCIDDLRSDPSADVDQRYLSAIGDVLQEPGLEKAMVALLLNPPTEAWLGEQESQLDAQSIHRAREQLKRAVATAHEDALWNIWQNRDLSEAYQPSAAQIGTRSLANTALALLTTQNSQRGRDACEQQCASANNMTDRLAALRALVNSEYRELADELLEQFYQQWQHEPLVVNEWFVLQAGCRHEDTLQRVQALMSHPAFDRRNPNKLRALVGAFCRNAHNFHRPDGAAYEWLADVIIDLDGRNPQLAARMLGPLCNWRRQLPEQSAAMRQSLQRIGERNHLSRDVFEVVHKSLGEGS